MSPAVPPARQSLGPLTRLAGIGPARAEKLARLGLEDVRDVLLCLPVGLEEWGPELSIAELAATVRPGELARVRGRVQRARFRRGPGRRSLVTVALADATGELDVLFYNQAWLRERFAVGDELEVRGRRSAAERPALVCERLGTPARALPAPGSVAPIYALCEGVSQEFVRALCQRTAEAFAGELDEPLEPATLARFALPELARAVRALHAPSTREDFERARRRVALEPILELQARLAARRAERDRGAACALALGPAQRARAHSAFPFELTAGQAAALADVAGDLALGRPMRRLVQGDVGSGKTAVGVFAVLAAALNGLQAAFLAPTEVLAEQHAERLAPWLARAGVSSALLTSSLAPRARRALLAELESGALDVVFGTHALFGGEVAYARLALAVVDEQQRFGVEERRRLLDKGRDVHALYLSATPIPRSLAMTLYGDLDVSTIPDRPPGRRPVTTRWLRGAEERELGALLEERLEAGERAYWVCPRIEGDAGAGPASATARHAALSRSRLGAFGVGLVHGRLEPAERARALGAFRSGETRLLVATTVIEVGVDVPEATLIVVESAERLGLAQLHQLRGRVGRADRPSACYLLGSAGAHERLRLLEREHDGFAIAAADLRLRGMGDLLGLRQAGPNAEGLGDPESAVRLLELARDLIVASPAVAREYLGAASGATLC